MRGKGAFLLFHGDKLKLTSQFVLTFHSLIPLRPSFAGPNSATWQEAQQFSSRYGITDRPLGVGGHGSVYAALDIKSERQMACKIIDIRTPEKEHKRQDRLVKLFREFEVLRGVDHPNIIRLEKVFTSSNNLFIFQELMTGGDLFSYIEFKGGKLEDVQSAVILQQVLKALEFLHNMDIVHRDLKPDNILMTSLSDSARVVLTDFGNARHVPAAEGKQRMFSMVGTLEYAAP